MAQELFSIVTLPGVSHAATVIIAIIAVLSLVVTTYSSRNEKVRQAADEVRLQLLEFAHETESVDNLYDDSLFVTLTTMGNRIGQELTRKIPSSGIESSGQGYVQYVASEDNKLLTLAVIQEVWERENRSTQRLLSAFASLHRSSHRFLGAYSLFRELALVYSPREHGVSPAAFVETLKGMAELESEGHGIIPSDLPDLLGDVAGGKLARNLDFRRAVREFIVNAVQCIVGLPAQDVLELARKTPESTNTHSGDARLLFEYIQKAVGNTSSKACERILSDLSEIESAAG